MAPYCRPVHDTARKRRTTVTVTWQKEQNFSKAINSLFLSAIIATLFPKLKRKPQMSRSMRFPTMGYVRPAKAQTSLRIRTVWSEPLLVAWVFYDFVQALISVWGLSFLLSTTHLPEKVWLLICSPETFYNIPRYVVQSNCGSRFAVGCHL